MGIPFAVEVRGIFCLPKWIMWNLSFWPLPLLPLSFSSAQTCRWVVFRLPVGDVLLFLLRSLLYSHWEGSCIPTEKGLVFPLGSLLYSNWEGSCIPIGKGLVFLLGIHRCSHWERLGLFNIAVYFQCMCAGSSHHIGAVESDVGRVIGFGCYFS